jgi:hypothetical protein
MLTRLIPTPADEHRRGTNQVRQQVTIRELFKRRDATASDNQTTGHSSHRITYVKPHGALSNISEVEREISDAVARAMRAVDPSLIFLAIAMSEHVKFDSGQISTPGRSLRISRL